MNGPMPHIWVMLIAVPVNRPMERWKWPERAGWVGLECMVAFA
jgi:hypothetical protein